MRNALIGFAAILSFTPAASPKELPVNQWVELPVKTRLRGYEYAEPIYVPSRGQLLHWGAIRRIYRVPHQPRNDVLAFDAEAGVWASDYPPADKLVGLRDLHNSGAGISYVGTGAMLDCGTPAPSMVVNAVCYDAKRDRVIYTMKGLMAAYDPKARKWRDLKARTIIYGREYPGGPPVYGAGTCYDPLNDEIVLFPHWSGGGDPKNTDLRDVTGEVWGHLGTFVYRFADNTWRRVGHTFGSAKIRQARKEVLELMRRASWALDAVWLLRRRPDAGLGKLLGAVLSALAGEARARGLPKAAASLTAAGEAPTPAEILKHGSEALRAFAAELNGPLRVEPPPRCAAPMVYDPRNRVIVLFGGHSGLVRSDIHPSVHLGLPPGGLNDTWLYDCTTRQWRQLRCSRRPPAQRRPRLFCDPASGLVLLATFHPADRRRKTPAKAVLWSLDAARGQWLRRGEQDWPWPLTTESCYASRTGLFNVGFDPRRRLLVLTQNIRKDRDVTQHTYVMRIDASKLPSAAAPEWKPDPPLVPQTVPPDDPKWVAKLKALPANRWVRAKPPRDATGRDWGNLACDPVRGWVFYFGGGHSTYQVNDVAVYAVGANRWSHAAGDHNDFVPPVGWGGVAMGFRGGRHAHHQRNQYVALDGRMVVSTGGVEKMARHGRIDAGRRPGPRYAWFYDVDRGGVWRQQRIARVTKGKGADGVWGAVHVADAAGTILGVVGNRQQYYGQTFPELFVSLYDAYANTLDVRKVPPPYPRRWPECRPFCMLRDKGRMFFYEYNRHTRRQVTWAYDGKANRFIDLKPRRQPPPGEPLTVEYLDAPEAVLAIIQNRPEKQQEQWLYSLKHNTWADLPIEGEGRVGFAGPYGQMVYVAKYGVLVNTGSANRGTSLMRPDASRMRWD